ncbi:letm1 and ef-hand domain-containing protein [Plasmopara halstedii]|uniref:Mitochondrial proton/calcium exchanger protein n=1 Tax=Plasmopara halstedii TaxID=4781 RepID=A0A0P1AVJ4_PLAHL|nr:letm1 and ef-hand domain-containing protein [Plasmopara halstedii]CEG46014.1 letm1 and ef-hand domain-containing protein [Plasmopara halstedii]|eukprot:XP_024582383.1 letm1 and ef-hand domain-containing protein [Plasmopara halstedii]
MLRLSVCNAARSQRILPYAGYMIPRTNFCAKSVPVVISRSEFSNSRDSCRPTLSLALTLPQYSPLLVRTQVRSFAAVPTKPSTTNTVATPTPAETAALKKKIAAARRRRSKIRVLEEKLESALEKGGERRMIRVQDVEKELPKVPERAVSLLKRTPQLAVQGVKAVARALQILFTDPAAVKEWLVKMKEKVKHEVDHYWLGTKLLYADVSTSTRILRRLLKGNALSRRERKQLQRTVADLLRLVPFAFFVVVPFMELLLPVALKVFPNMLPSTYKDSYQREEDMKRQLQLRVALAGFLQDTVKEIMQDTRDTEGVSEERKATASEVMNFIERAQRGEPLTSDETLQVAQLFNDELMLDNISRPQLVGMCRFMGVQHYGNDNLLRFQLRNRIRQLKKDDQDIIWEGLDSLDKEELQMACMERGMRATGLTKAGYVRQMRQWLDLSINKNVPASLLIMSRALNITATDNLEQALATSMSSMDDEVVTEVALAAKAYAEGETAEMRKLKLDSIRYQNEMIADEEKFRDEAQKKESEAQKQAESEVTKTEVQTEVEQVIADVIMEKAKSQATTATAATTSVAATETKLEEETPVVPKSIENIVSLEELSALESLAFKSLVEKERQTVSQLKQNKYDMDVEKLLAAGRIGAQTAENKTAGRMMKKLESMLSNLEVEIEEVDRHVGDRLNILDRDSDGVLSAEELRDAVMTILRKANNQEDVEWVISHIDEDNDGKIALEELVAWIAKCRESLEATGRIALQEPSDTSAEGAAAAESEKTKIERAEKAKVKRTNSRKKKEKEQ